MTLIQRILNILYEAEWKQGTLPDRGIMPTPFPVLDKHQTWDKHDPRLSAAPLVRVPLSVIHATQSTVESETIAKFIQEPELGGPPVVTPTESGYAIVDGHHRLSAARIRGEQSALVRVVEEDGAGGAAPAGVPANNAGTGNIAGLGVGPKGEPGVDLRMSKKRKKEIAALATQTGTPITEATHNVKRIAVAPSANAEFWKIGDEVYRAPYKTSKDTQGYPMGKRWECSYQHWLNYRKTAYAWVDDLKERLHESPADTFGNADVFDVDMDRLLRIQQKQRWERYSKYLELDEVGEDIRQHARKNWKRDIILRDSKTGVMRFLRRRSSNN